MCACGTCWLNAWPTDQPQPHTKVIVCGQTGAKQILVHLLLHFKKEKDLISNTVSLKNISIKDSSTVIQNVFSEESLGHSLKETLVHPGLHTHAILLLASTTLTRLYRMLKLCNQSFHVDRKEWKWKNTANQLFTRDKRLISHKRKPYQLTPTLKRYELPLPTTVSQLSTILTITRPPHLHNSLSSKQSPTWSKSKASRLPMSWWEKNLITAQMCKAVGKWRRALWSCFSTLAKNNWTYSGSWDGSHQFKALMAVPWIYMSYHKNLSTYPSLHVSNIASENFKTGDWEYAPMLLMCC